MTRNVHSPPAVAEVALLVLAIARADVTLQRDRLTTPALASLPHDAGLDGGHPLNQNDSGLGRYRETTLLQTAGFGRSRLRRRRVQGRR